MLSGYQPLNLKNSLSVNNVNYDATELSFQSIAAEFKHHIYRAGQVNNKVKVN